MKITLISNAPIHTGVGRYAFTLYRELNELKNLDLEMVLTDPLYFSQERPDARFIYGLRLGPVNHLVNYFILPSLIGRINGLVHILTQSLGRLSIAHRPTVVTVHDIGHITGISPGWSNYRFRIFRTIHNSFSSRSTKSIKHADALIFVSNFTLNETAKQIDISKTKKFVIYPGIDHTHFRQRDKQFARRILGLPLDKKIMLNVGDENPRKNIPGLLQSLSLMEKNRSDLLLARVGEKLSNTVELVNKLGLSNKVVHFGNVSEHMLPYFYNAADILIQPSFYEGFGFPVLEAMSSGCPVLSSNSGAIPEVAGNAAILNDPNDIDSIACSALSVLDSESLSRNFIEKGFEKSGAFTWKRSAYATFEVYRDTIHYRK